MGKLRATRADPVHPPRWTTLGSRVYVLAVADQPPCGLKPGHDRVQGAAGQVGQPHQLEPVPWLSRIVKKRPQHPSYRRSDPHLVLHVGILHRVERLMLGLKTVSARIRM